MIKRIYEYLPYIIRTAILLLVLVRVKYLFVRNIPPEIRSLGLEGLMSGEPVVFFSPLPAGGDVRSGPSRIQHPSSAAAHSTEGDAFVEVLNQNR